MTAIDLARLRSLGAAPVAEIASVARVAAEVGREPIRVGRDVVLARHVDAPAPHDLGVAASMLSNSALVALGLCVGLAWHDRERHPYPGRPVAFDDVAEAARSLRIEVSAARHLIGAIRHVLADARLLEIEGDQIRLGPAVAAWCDADLEAFRRNLDVLPEPAEESQ